MEQDPERAAAMLLGLGDACVLDVDAVHCPSWHASVVLEGTEEFEQPRPLTFGRATLLVWMLRRFRCENGACPVQTFVEEVPPLSPA